MSSTTTVTATELGGPVPSLPHAISVSLPTWKDNVDYEEGAKRVVDSMKTGYPRFFIHRHIQLLAKICEEKFGRPGERCLLFPSATVADSCRAFLRRYAPTPITVRLVQYAICPQSATLFSSKTPLVQSHRRGDSQTLVFPSPSQDPEQSVELNIVFFPDAAFSLAKSFWQHTGDGISSRMAEKCLEMATARLQSPVTSAATNGSISSPRAASQPSARGPARYKKDAMTRMTSTSKPPSPPPQNFSEPDHLTSDHTTYLEERYGRNLPLTSASIAKRALRRRIAGVLLRDSNSPQDPVEPLGEPDPNADVVGESWRGVRDVSEEDVFLYPTGMSAIWHSHQLLLGSVYKIGREPGKSVSFGFPYTDTLKILQKWGPGCQFFGNGLDSDIPDVEEYVRTSVPPVLALYCEFPSNPLLRSPNLARLRKLADKYGFMIVVDETIGNFVNVDVLRFADIVVSSITKVFSGETNVMGGALVLNPLGQRYHILRDHLRTVYEDMYWPEDSLYMERNSRDFQRRINIININAEYIAEFLRSKSKSYLEFKGVKDDSIVIKEVYYPKWVTPENFDACKNPHQLEGAPSYPSGYGGLLSMTFTSSLAAQVFFDNLGCEKGPSLGTNFTLACPYTVLAHYNELDWAESWGVDRGLVRVSVGMEDKQKLFRWFEYAVRAAEEAVRKGSLSQ